MPSLPPFSNSDSSGPNFIIDVAYITINLLKVQRVSYPDSNRTYYIYFDGIKDGISVHEIPPPYTYSGVVMLREDFIKKWKAAIEYVR